MFQVGDEVKVVDTKVWGTYWGQSYIKGLEKRNNKRPHKSYIVMRTRDYSDDSQQLWVRSKFGTDVRGPYCNLRFESVSNIIVNDYDPTQMGDTDDDI
jgi:hypothetical protein